MLVFCSLSRYTVVYNGLSWYTVVCTVVSRIRVHPHRGNVYLQMKSTDPFHREREQFCPCKNCNCLVKQPLQLIRNHLLLVSLGTNYSWWIDRFNNEVVKRLVDEFRSSSEYRDDSSAGDEALPPLENNSEDDAMPEAIGAQQPWHRKLPIYHYADVDPVQSMGDIRVHLQSGYVLPSIAGGEARTMNEIVARIMDTTVELNTSNEGFGVLMRSHFMDYPKEIQDNVPATFDQVYAQMKNAKVLTDVEYFYLCACKTLFSAGARTRRKRCFRCSRDPGNMNDAGRKVFGLFDIPGQVRALFLDRVFREHVEDHTKRRTDGRMQTIYDGPAWEQQTRDLGLTSLDLRVVLSTDGVSLFDKTNSKQTTYPIILEIANLSGELRRKEEYVIIVGFTIGKVAEEDEVFQLIYDEIMMRLNALWRDGVKVVDITKDHSLEDYVTTVRLICIGTRHDTVALDKVSTSDVL